jgi:DNA modification methylase
MKIEQIKIRELKENPKNPRLNDPAVDAVARSIQAYGFNNPIITDEQLNIAAGHTRLKAAIKLGLETVPVIRVPGLIGTKFTGYAIADNQTATIATWDDDVLKQLVAALNEDDSFDLLDLGFDEHALSVLLEAPTDEDKENAVPDIPKIPITKLGDVWLLGDHRLICGDATNEVQVKILMEKETSSLCFTSPPYNKQRDYKNKIVDWDALMIGAFRCLPVKDDGQVLVNLGLIHREGKWVEYWRVWMNFMIDAGWNNFGWYVWDQGSGLPGDWNGRLAPSFEFIFHFNRAAIKLNKCIKTKPDTVKRGRKSKNGKGLRGTDGVVRGISSPSKVGQKYKIPDSVLRITRNMSSSRHHHPATFPVALPELILQTYSQSSHICYDPFVGSGTTIIAAEKLNRRCFAIEIDPGYCDVVVERWEQFTGGKAERQVA